MSVEPERTSTPDIVAGRLRIYPKAGTACIGGKAVRVGGAAFDLLTLLARKHGEVVPHDSIWRDAWGTEPGPGSVLRRAIGNIRRAIKDADSGHWVSTVHGVGYRLADPTNSGQSASRLKPFVVGLVCSLAMAALIALAWMGFGQLVAAPRVAILPVEISDDAPELEWVQYGVLPLMEQTLRDAQVPQVSTGSVLSTLKRTESSDLSPSDPVDVSRVLRLNTGAERVLLPRLTLVGGQYQLTLSSVDEGEPISLMLRGDDPVSLAVAMSGQLPAVSNWKHNPSGNAFRQILSSDPFINEAYARGLDARLRSRWPQARDAFETVLNADPNLHWAKYQLTLVTRRQGDLDATERLNQELLRAARESGDQELEGSVLTTSGTLAWRRGETQEAERLYRLAESVFAEINSRESLASVYGNLAILASIRADFDVAEGLYQRAVDTYEESGNQYNRAAVLKNLGVMNMDRGRLGEAMGALQQSLDLRQRMGLQREASLTLHSMARIDMRRGRWADAAVFQQRVLSIARETGDQLMVVEALCDLAKIAGFQGQLTKARTLAREAMSESESVDNHGALALATLTLANQLRGESAAGEGSALAERALSHYETIESEVGQYSALLTGIRIAVDSGEYGRAQSLVDQLIDRFGDSRNEGLRLARLRVEARLAQAENDQQRAARLWNDALAIATSIDLEIERVQTYSEACIWSFSTQPPHLFERDIITPLIDTSIELAVRYRCLSLASLSNGDPEAAMMNAQRWKLLAGENWSHEDESRLRALGDFTKPDHEGE